MTASDLARGREELALAVGTALAPLQARLRTPLPKVELGVFMGDYPFTAFGAHRDQVDVLLQQHAGRKRLWLWPPRAIEPLQLERFGGDYRRFLPLARSFDLRRGDLLYWPAGWWHVGESEGPQVSLNLGFHTRGGTFANPVASPAASR